MSGFVLIAIALAALGLLGWLSWERGVIGVEAISKSTEPSPDRDKRMIADGTCPDCGKKELLGGPSGGMSQNIGCNYCLMEFNVHHHFGGILGVDRTGKMTESRAAVFGIQADEYREIVALQEKADG